MKTKNLALAALAATTSFSQIATAQNHHPALKNLVSKINTNGEHMSITKLDGDIGAIKQYIDVILKTVRKNGDAIPKNLNAKDLFNITGLDTLKSSGSSAKELENAWINHTYIENGGSSTGIFSFIGKTNQEHIAASFLPADTDLALQLQLDLRKLVPMLVKVLKLTDQEDQANDLTEEVPGIDINTMELFEKLNITVNLGVDVSTDEAVRDNPLTVLNGANAIIRIDGLTWLWDKVEANVLPQANLPLNRSEDATTGIITYSTPDEVKAKFMGYSPQIIVDKKNDHIWITTTPEFYSKCQSTENKLIDSPAFKAAMEHLPSKANSMMFASKELLLTAQAQYEFAAKNNMLGKDLEKGKEVIDRLMEDLTESDKGWAIVLNKDEMGIMLASRGPAGVHHLDYLSKIMTFAAIGAQ